MARRRVQILLPPEAEATLRAAAVATRRSASSVVASGIAREIAALSPESAEAVERIRAVIGERDDRGGNA